MSQLYYFAYGSNLSIKRLQQRVPSAEFLNSGLLTGHQLKFHKRNRDGSSKADCFFTGSELDQLWGAVFVISAFERELLDAAEGLGNGYELKEVDVLLKSSSITESQKAFTYYATDLIDDYLPYDWYINHILVGAQEVGLPEHYQQLLARTEHKLDLDRERSARERVIYVES